MPAIKYVVELSEPEREQLRQLIRKGTAPARKLTRARMLLLADAGRSDEQVAQALQAGSATVGRARQRFVEEGLESALSERPRCGHHPKLTGQQEAHLIAVACSAPPQGHARWTLRLLAGRVVALGFAETYSYEAVRRVLKKTTSSPGKRSSGVSPR